MPASPLGDFATSLAIDSDCLGPDMCKAATTLPASDQTLIPVEGMQFLAPARAVNFHPSVRARSSDWYRHDAATGPKFPAYGIAAKGAQKHAPGFVKLPENLLFNTFTHKFIQFILGLWFSASVAVRDGTGESQ